MNQTIKRIALIAAVLALPASGAMATPMAWFAFNGGPHHFINNWIQDQEGDWSGNFFLSTPLYHVVGNVHVQADPQIVYGVSVANSSPGMGTFTFDFTDTWATPIVGQTETYGAVGGHVTDATGNGISLNRVNPYLQMTDLNGLDSNTDAYNHDFARGPGFPRCGLRHRDRYPGSQARTGRQLHRAAHPDRV